MNRKLAVSSIVFSVPLALALASSPAHASKTATGTKTTAVRNGNSVTKQATTIGPNGNVIATSIRDWQPGSLNRQPVRATPTPAEIRRERRQMRRVAARERAQEVEDRR